MPPRESGRPNPEQKTPATGGKETNTEKQSQPPKDKADGKPESSQTASHSPAEARLKSFEQTVGPDGSVRIKREYYDTVPEAPSATETARAKAAESGGAKEAGPANKTETTEAKKEAPVSGAAVVEEIKNDPQAPKEVKEALNNPENAKAVADAVENKSVFGQRAKNFFRRFGTGMAAVGAKAGIKFLAKRTLDFGTVGAGALAGGVVGGTFEGIKSYRAETKRLYDLKTYRDALAGYDSMTNLDKVTAAIALEAKLKERFSGKTLKPAEHAELQAQLLNLRVKLEKVTGKSAESADDAEKIQELLQFRDPNYQRDELVKEGGKVHKFFSDVWANIKDAKKEGLKDKELLKKVEVLAGLLKTRTTTDRELLKSEQSANVKKLLDNFYKERGLNRNVKKIAWETTKGAVFGAAGGAAGAYLFEHAANFAASHGWISKDLVGHGGPGHGSDVGHPGGSASLHGADASHAVAPGAETLIQVPSPEDTQILHKTVWDTCKQYMIDHGVQHPSVHDINEAMIRICHENGIEISGHHNVADFPGFHHEHFKDLIDIKLHNGLSLHGFDKLSDLVNHAGGHAMGTQEILTHIPGADAAKNAHDWLINGAPKHLAEEERSLRNIWYLVGGGAVGLGAITYGLRKAFKKNQQENSGSGRNTETATNLPPVELMGSPEELKTATLERRLELLDAVKVEALRRIAKAGTNLEGDQPDIGAFQKDLLLVYAVYNPQQLEHLSQGASAGDITKITAAWRAMEQELRDAVMPLGEKAQRIMEDEYEKNRENDEDSDSQQDGDGPEEAKKTETEKDTKVEAQKVIAEKEKAFKSAIKNAEAALAAGKPEEASNSHLEAASALSALSLEAKKLSGNEKKEAEKIIKASQKKLDDLRKKIETAKSKQPKKEVTPPVGGGTENKTERDLEAEKLGLQGWELKYYHQMVKLRLMQALPEGRKFLPDDKDRDRLGKFILLAREQGSIFESLTKGGARKLRGDFLDALTKLKQENNPEALKNFCLKILERGQNLNKSNQAISILQEMDNIGTEVGVVVGQAIAEFKATNKK
jgi:hypothetical protein